MSRYMEGMVGTVSTYVVQRGDYGPVKIGKSGNPDARLRQLQTGCAEPLNLLGLIHDEGAESELHDAFWAYRLEGEWFRPAPEVVEVLRERYDILVNSPPPAPQRPRLEVVPVTWAQYKELVEMGLASPPRWDPLGKGAA